MKVSRESLLVRSHLWGGGVLIDKIDLNYTESHFNQLDVRKHALWPSKDKHPVSQRATSKEM